MNNLYFKSLVDVFEKRTGAFQTLRSLPEAMVASIQKALPQWYPSLLSAQGVMQKALRIENIDQPLDDMQHKIELGALKFLHKKQFLTYTPSLQFVAGTSTSICLDGSGYGDINIATRLDGQVVGSPQGNIEDRVFWRLSVLLHEASHAEFDLIQSPFKGQTAHDEWLNRFAFHPLIRMPLRQALSEAFCDAYSQMMLFQLNNTSQLKTHLERMISWRQNHTDQAHISYRGCAQVLQKVLERFDDWSSLAPLEIKNKALEYASQVVLDNIQSQEFLDQLFPKKPVLNIDAVVRVFVMSSLDHTRDMMLSNLKKNNEHHPMWPLIEHATPILNACIDHNMAQNINVEGVFESAKNTFQHHINTHMQDNITHGVFLHQLHWNDARHALQHHQAVDFKSSKHSP